jgi:tetrapyrrole methylase family protein/MazG family protein
VSGSERENSASDAFAHLIALMHRLRAPGGCPWDAEQTHGSIKNYLIEEAYEAVEAIDRASDGELRDELGDVLLQVVFHAEMAAERQAFDIRGVIDGLSAKLIRRHPHVFGDETARSSEEVTANWARIKAQERNTADTAPTNVPYALAGVPRALPALLRAHRLGQKAAAANFDWDTPEEVRAKLEEEIRELDAALAQGDAASAARELGDVVFTAASLARKLGCNAETLVQAALDRFERRFKEMERDLCAHGKAVESSSPGDLQAAWDRAKRREPRD